MQVDQALAILGLRTNSSEEEIKQQYRRLVKAGNHPDHCSTYFGKAKASKNFRKFTEAKDILIAHLQHRPFYEDLSTEPSYDDTEKTDKREKKKKENSYKYFKSSKEEFSDKLWDKIFPSGWFGDFLGMLLAFPMFIFMLTALPVSFGLNYLFIKIGIEPEDGPQTIAHHFVALIRQSCSFLLGGILVYFFFISPKEKPEWFDAYIILGYLAFWLIFSLIEWLSFLYYIHFLRKHKKALTLVEL